MGNCLQWFLILFAISLVLVIILTIFFHPAVNSILTMILLGYLTYKIGNVYVYLYFAIVCIDCIRDVILAHKFYKYEESEYTIDVFYVIKSILSIVTFGAARIIYFFIVYPIIACVVKKSVDKKIAEGAPIPKNSPYYFQAFSYYYNKYLSKVEANGILIDNSQTVDIEVAASKKKLDKLYPKKLVEKVADTFIGSKEIKAARKNAEEKLFAYGRYRAYLPSEKYNTLSDRITNALSDKGMVPLYEILKLDGLKDTLTSTGSPEDSMRWEYFIIQSLKPLVSDGSFEDNDLNNEDPLDNHAYHYVNSTKPMPSMDADNNPLMALDDD